MSEQDNVVPLRGSDLTLGPHAFQTFTATVPSDITAEQLVSNQLWSHVLNKLQVTDEIRILADDFSWRAMLIVTFNDKKNVKMRIIDRVALDHVELFQDVPSEYELKLKGPLKWCIVRLSDGEHIKEGLATKQEAAKELDDYIESLGD